MLQLLLSALPIALIWCSVTGHVTLDSFGFGFVLGLLTLILLRQVGVRYAKVGSLRQPLAMLIYTGVLLWSAFTSSVRVARLVLTPDLRLKTAILAVKTSKRGRPNELLTALSAHGITATPGQFVLDIDDDDTLYVHCLELPESREALEHEQAERLKLLRPIIGE